MLSWTRPAEAQSILPDTGTTVQVGSLRQQLESLLAAGTGGTAREPGWTLVPSIGVGEGWTNNIAGSGGTTTNNKNSSGSSFFTTVSPALLINADTARVQGTLNYAPTARIYDSQSGQDQFGQYLNASALVTLLPDQLFVDMKGYAGLQATSGGFGPNGTAALSRQNTTQSYSGSVTPYLREHFGDYGTAELGGLASYTAQNQLGSLSNNSPLATAVNNSLNNEYTTTTREYLTFISGPELGRFSVNPLVSATQMNGTGVTNNAWRNIATVDGGYAITRNITALAKIGYEDIHYSGVVPFNVNDVVWSVGTRLVPNPDSTITVRYGHQDGFNSALLDGSYAPTERTRVYARYSEGIGTGLEDLQNALGSSVLDPLGNPVDPTTGAPLLLTNNAFAVQGNQTLYRTKRGSLTGTLLLDLDSISLTISYQSQTPVATATLAAAAAAAAAGTNSHGTSGSINWQHDFPFDLTSTVYVQYGTNDNIPLLTRTVAANTGQATDTLVVSASLRYAFSDTLFGNLQYSYTSQSSTSVNRPTSYVLASIRKTF